MPQVFERDSEGNVLNPPNNPLFEQELTRARDSGDDEYVQRVQRGYDEWRADEVEHIESQGETPQAADASNAGPAPGAEPVSVTNPDPAPADDPAPAPAPTNDPAQPGVPEIQGGNV